MRVRFALVLLFAACLACLSVGAEGARTWRLKSQANHGLVSKKRAASTLGTEHHNNNDKLKRDVVDHDSCPETFCIHGGYPSEDCSHCLECYAAYHGEFCDEYIHPGTPEEIEKASKELWDSLETALNADYTPTFTAGFPLPGKVGFGVDAITGNVMLSVVKLTYSEGGDTLDTTIGVATIPDQAEVTQYDPQHNDVLHQKSFAYRDYDDYVADVKEYNETLLVHGGLFAQPYDAEHVFNTYFKSVTSLGVGQYAYQTHELTLKGGIGGLEELELHPQCVAALLMLPPTMNSTFEKQMYHDFISVWGTSFAWRSKNGGILEQLIKFPKFLAHEHNWNQETLENAVHTDMTNLMENRNDALPYQYANTRELDAFICYGGNPETTCTAADHDFWKDSLELQPAPIAYDIESIAELVEDPATRSNLRKAFALHIHQTQELMIEIDTCPKCKHGVCTAPYTMCACDGNYGNIFKRDCSECNPSHMDYASGCQTLSPYGACVTGNECQGWPCHCNNAGVCEIPAGYSTDFDGCCVGVNGGGGNQNQLQNHINNAQTPNRHHQHYQHYTDAVVHSCWPGDPIDPFYSGDGPIDPY